MNICINHNCGHEEASRLICQYCGSEMNPTEEFAPDELQAIRKKKNQREELSSKKQGECLHFY
jgi:hypothetical protein